MREGGARQGRFLEKLRERRLKAAVRECAERARRQAPERRPELLTEPHSPLEVVQHAEVQRHPGGIRVVAADAGGEGVKGTDLRGLEFGERVRADSGSLGHAPHPGLEFVGGPFGKRHGDDLQR